MRIGVLALQGAFIEHEKMLAKLGAESFEIRQLRDIDQPMDGLIIPGGESTVQGKLLRELGLMEPVRSRIRSGIPVYGTCAGLILLAKEIDGGEAPHIGVMDIVAKRNAYGRQLGSFSARGELKGIGEIPMTFIRAPHISRSTGAEILGEVDGKAIAARQDNMLVTAFHPELTADLSVHRYFLNMI
ncbi:MAG: pyridoxal 5'-phosphate synthase glutaminase subunit PdxT [Oscillospiraceae bacterium]